VVAKVIGRNVIHKTEAGGVRLNLATPEAAAEAYDRICRDVVACHGPDAVEGVMIRPMIPSGGHEVIVGARRDPSFGPVVMFGLGGVTVELFRDVAFATAPIGTDAARRLIARTRAGRLLSGLRRAPPCDVEQVARHVAAVSQLINDFPRVAELDVNPLICAPGELGAGVMVADARVRLTESR
jgi:acetyltransferase